MNCDADLSLSHLTELWRRFKLRSVEGQGQCLICSSQAHQLSSIVLPLPPAPELRWGHWQESVVSLPHEHGTLVLGQESSLHDATPHALTNVLHCVRCLNTLMHLIFRSLLPSICLAPKPAVLPSGTVTQHTSNLSAHLHLHPHISVDCMVGPVSLQWLEHSATPNVQSLSRQ